MLKEIQKDRGLTWLLLVGVAGLLFVVIRDYSTGMPPFPRGSRSSVPLAASIPVARFPELFTVAQVPRLAAASNQVSVFHTTAFQPAPPPPPPPPPTTRKVALTYLGFFELAEGPRRVVVQVGDSVVVGALGSNVVADLAVSQMEFDSLVLTNREGKTNRLEFKKKQTVEVPVQ